MASRPKKVVTRGVLDRPAVVAAALRLVDRSGFEALTMGAVARELGAGTMTLYGYFRCKDELLDAVCAELLGQVRDPGPDGDWPVQLRAVLRQLRDVLCAHPGIVGHYASRPGATPGALRPLEALAGVLRRAGFGGSAAAAALLSTYGQALGLVLLEASRRALPGGPDRAVHLELQLRSLPAAEFPQLRELGPVLARTAESDAFDRGVDGIVAGLEARLEASRRRQRAGRARRGGSAPAADG